MNFDEVLTNPDYQAEFDKRVAKAIETSKTKWEAEAKKELEENARLSAEEKTKKEYEKILKENQELKANEARRQMKDNSLEYIKSKGYNTAIADLVDLSSFKDEDEMHNRLDSINTTYSNTVSKAIDSKLKERGYQDITPNKGEKKPETTFDFNFTKIKED